MVDDEPASRAAVVRLLQAAGHVAQAFAGAADFLAVAATAPAGCAVIDLHLPGMSGLASKAALAAVGSTLPVVILADEADARTAVRAMKAGVVDFLPRPFEEAELLDAVARALARDAAERAARTARAALSAQLDALSAREREVCERAARGQANKEIAAALGITESTVKVHRRNGMEKLGVESLLALAELLGRARR